MEAQFNIVVNMKTPKGLLEMGNFFVGNAPDFALNTFRILSGSNQTDTMLRMDLVKKEVTETLGEIIETKGCTLDQFTRNCKIIARDVFKFFTLETSA